MSNPSPESNGVSGNPDSLSLGTNSLAGGTPAATEARELSVVVPFYNPGASVGTVVAELLHQFDSAGIDGEVIAVDDGSTDGSGRSVAALDDDRVTVITLPVNSGKGAALRAGFRLSNARYVGMIDSDGDISPRHLIEYRELAVKSGCPIVIGSRGAPGSQNHVSGKRRLMSEAYSGLVALLFDVRIRDTQVGCKLFDSAAMQQILPQLTENRFVVDLEMLVVAAELGIGPVVEAPVEIRRVTGSTIKPTTALRMVIDTLALYRRRRQDQSAQHELEADSMSLDVPSGPRSVELFGVAVTDEHPYDFVSRCTREFAADRKRRTVLAMHITALNAIDQPGVRDGLAAADYLHADGVSVSIIAKCAGARAIAAIPTTDLGPRYLHELEALQGRPVRVAILGGEPGIAQAAGGALARDHGVEIVMTEHGFQDDWQPVLDELRLSEPDVVFVGLGMPLEALWVQQWLSELPDAMIITCGGWLRLLSGDETRAPAWLLRLHLEFAWRWATDFKRTNARYSRGIKTVAVGCAGALRSRRSVAAKQRSLAP